ncbi:hypothetical protein L208DRAFT_1389082, partial [Tricholoma matsutake]
YTTWQISFKKLSSKAATFLQLCAFMHHDGISEETFRKVTAMTFKKVPSSATDFLCNFLDVNQDLLDPSTHACLDVQCTHK